MNTKALKAAEAKARDGANECYALLGQLHDATMGHVEDLEGTRQAAAHAHDRNIDRVAQLAATARKSGKQSDRVAYRKAARAQMQRRANYHHDTELQAQFKGGGYGDDS